MQSEEYIAMSEREANHWWFVSKRLFLGALFQIIGIKKYTNLKIADIGSGIGGMIPFLKQYGRVVGIEPSGIARQLGKRAGHILQSGTAHKTRLLSGSIDMVCILDVLYHKGVNERQAFDEAWRILKPRGWLIITDCAYQSLFGPHDVFVEAKKRYRIADFFPYLEDAHFQIQTSTYIFFLIFPFFALARLVDRFLWFLGVKRVEESDLTTVHPLLNAALIDVCRLETKLFRWTHLPWGSSLFIAAQKSDRT